MLVHPTNAGALDNFPGNGSLFKFKQKITSKTGNHATKDVKTIIPLKLLSIFWRTLEMPLINYKINLILNWSKNFVISNTAANQDTTFAITDTKLYVPGVTLSTKYYNRKLLQQAKLGFKSTINQNKYQSKTATQNAPKQFLDYLIDLIFQGLNRRFVLAFNVIDNRIGHSRYYLPTAKLEDYNVMIDGKNIFNQPKITTGQEDDYTTGCLLELFHEKL